MPAISSMNRLRRSSRSPAGSENRQRYWDCLANNMQWQYGYGHVLPADPPLISPPCRPSASSGGHRHPHAYWHRAQHVCICHCVAERVRVEFKWTTEWIQNGGDALHHLFERLGN